MPRIVNRLTQEERARLSPYEIKARMEHIRDTDCPEREIGRTHGDPDSSGQCIYCGAVLDIMEEDFL